MLIVALGLCGAAFAQPAQGDRVLQGSVGLNVLGQFPDPSGTSTLSQIAIQPQYGVFVNEHWALGVSAGYAIGWQGSRTSGDFGKNVVRNSVSLYHIGFEADYYLRLAERFYLSLDGFVGYVGGFIGETYKVDGWKDCTTTPMHGALLSVTPALRYFINDRWMLSASLGNVAVGIMSGAAMDRAIYYAGANWGQIMLGVGFKF